MKHNRVLLVKPAVGGTADLITNVYRLNGRCARMIAMRHSIRNAEDVAWFLAHTHGFRGGFVTDVHVSKRRLFDEGSGRDVPAGTTVTTVIRYQVRGTTRVAKLTMLGVTDFSIFEQEGADCSTLGVIHAEVSADRLRFWFDPQGELYVVCEEAELEEISKPADEAALASRLAQWTFQAESGEGPTIEWLLAELDRAGLPCSWKAKRVNGASHPAVRWEGHFIPAASREAPHLGSVFVRVYGPLDGAGFGIVLQTSTLHNGQAGRVLGLLADLIARTFSGNCLVGNTIIPGMDWINGKLLERARWADETE
jgi:hypothetical protein